MDPDTRISGPESRFPETRRSAIVDLSSPEPHSRAVALETLIAAYWKPVYKYVRVRWSQSNENAKDLTQAFFARAMEKEFFCEYDPAKARFRTYVRVCLDGFVANENKSAGRIKRGGETGLVSLDFDIASTIPTPEEYFHQEWVRNLFTLAAEDLKRECEEHGRRVQFAAFERYDLSDSSERPSYSSLAIELGLTATAVTNYLAAMRRRFRACILARIRESTGSEQEFRDEVRAALGVDV